MLVCVLPPHWGGLFPLWALPRITRPQPLWGTPIHSGAGLYPKVYSCITPKGLARSPWTRPSTGFSQGESLQLWSKLLPQLWNRTLVHYVGSQVGIHWTPIISLQQLRSDMMARYPDYQVEPSEPAPNKTTSLGLAIFQQAKPEKEAHLPLSPSLEAWLTVQANTLEGKTDKGK